MAFQDHFSTQAATYAVAAVAAEMAAAWGEPQRLHTVRWPLVVRAGRNA